MFSLYLEQGWSDEVEEKKKRQFEGSRSAKVVGNCGIVCLYMADTLTKGCSH